MRKAASILHFARIDGIFTMPLRTVGLNSPPGTMISPHHRKQSSSSEKSWAGKRRWLLSQYLVNERDRDRPFADSRGDAFDVAATNIPGSENSGHTAF